VKSLQEQIKQLNTDKDELYERIELEKSAQQGQTEAEKALRNNIDKLEEKNNVVNRELLSLQEKLNHTMAEIEQRTTDNDELRERIEQEKIEKKDHTAAEKALYNQIDELNSVVEEERATNSEQNAVVKSFQNQRLLT